MTSPDTSVDFTQQTRYSDPGEFGALVRAVPPDPDVISRVVKNVIVHYRASPCALPPETNDEINLMTVAAKLAADQLRHPGLALEDARDEPTRVQGCCRDHTLLALSILRSHGVPARSRVGFARYFSPAWHHDHVIPEWWNGSRWVSFEFERDAPSDALATPRDVAADEGAFEDAHEVWLRYRREGADISTYGVSQDLPFVAGPWLVQSYVICELAHHFGDELLLWQGWGAMAAPGGDLFEELTDEVAGLLARAKAGDTAADVELNERYRTDDRLHPGVTVNQHDPRDQQPPHRVDLASAP